MARWILVSLLIHLSFPPSVIISVLHLLKQGMERRGKKLLSPGAVVAIGDIEGGLVAAAVLPEIGNVRPSYGDGVGARGERGASVGVGRKKEGKKLLRT